MKVKATAQHLGEGQFPTFAKDTPVKMGVTESRFPHWFPCVIEGHETYVPEMFVNNGKLVMDYNPTELVAEVGVILDMQEIVCGWLLAANADGVVGWIPAESVISE